jgi:beta-1,4-mannooligosaccharide/beta-1,4-mannosyl-N-acetylglucosamine phosphorylase
MTPLNFDPPAAKSATVAGDALPNMPWQDKPPGHPHPVWRHAQNPVIPRSPFPACNSVFNSAVVPFEGKFAGVFRCDSTARDMQLHTGFSDDGIGWRINPERIRFQCDVPEIAAWDYGYDPRVVWIEDRYWVTWCNGCHGPTIGLAWTRDFETFHQIENCFLPFNRNGVLFPRKIAGSYVMLSRPSDNGHTPFGDIFLSSGPDMIHWGKHRHVMSSSTGWQHLKIGAGPVPIETREGWLLFYHGVLRSCNGYVYSWGAALLDLDEPWKVIRRSHPYLLNPRETYECAGDVPNVTFPTAALCDAPTGRIAIYYGCADTVTGLAFCQADEILAWLEQNSRL